jgi:hypothetical protein
MSITQEIAVPAAVRNPNQPVPAPRLGRLPGEQVLMSGVGLRISNDLSYEDWEKAGRQLSGIVDSSSWWLGDWLVYGKKNFSDRYVRAIRTAGLQYQTLRNYAWVARRFDLSRRRSRLSFQHHAEVASLPTEEQDWWLDRAEQASWTTKQLRTQIRAVRSEAAGTIVAKERAAMIPRIEVPNRRLVWWRKAADQSGFDFDRWVLATLDQAAAQALEEEATAVEA